MTARRIELISRRSVVAMPYRLPVYLVPHALLACFILVAWVYDFGVHLCGWIGL